MKGSPSSSASAARWWPNMRGASRLLAASGTRPRLTKGIENAALSPAYTRSQWNSMVVPMPTAGPHTAAISGLGKAAMPRRKRNTGESSPAGLFLRKSSMSLPAENTVSCPWMTTTRVAASSAACAMAVASASYMATLMEFLRSTRLKVSVRTPASWCWRISDMVLGGCWVRMRFKQPDAEDAEVSQRTQKRNTKQGSERFPRRRPAAMQNKVFLSSFASSAKPLRPLRPVFGFRYSGLHSL